MSIELGTAGEHIVCADLLLSGHKASLAMAGCAYDVVADIAGKLIKITVKSCSIASARSGRSASKPVYKFSVQRHQKKRGGVYNHLPYSSDDVDLVALVALDHRRVAYLSIKDCPQIVLFEPIPARPSDSHFGPKGRQNYQWEQRSLAAALERMACHD